jgi:hypothetical protein
MKTKTKLIIIAAVVIAILSAVIGLFALLYVPKWYDPQTVTSDQQQQLRDDITKLTRTFNNNIQKPKPFEFSISAREVNRLISGLEYLDPELKNIIPSEVINPAVEFDDDYLKVGAIIQRDGKKVFANFRLRIEIDNELLRIDELSVYLGLVRVPQSRLENELGNFIEHLHNPYFPIAEILEKREFPNRFRYPHGNIDFRITRLKADKGVLYVTLEPIEGG